MRIVVLNREAIEKIPPLISVVQILRDLGHEVILVTTAVTEKNKEMFKKRGIEVFVIPYKITKNLFERVINVWEYRKKIKYLLRELDFDYIWIEGAGTFRTVINIVDKYKYVMQISELYDYPEAKPIRRAIKKLIYRAEMVVMPEFNRATLYQVGYGLKTRPEVLPNKPYFYLNGEELKFCEKKYEKDLKVFKEKKVILYQGIIAKERNLSNYIKAVKELGEDYVFVLLGSDYGMLEEYRKIDPEIIHIDFIPAPDYLVFTMHAYIGIISYEATTLNCAYCAPNKIYEYGQYSLPMLGNDIPGLRNTVGLHNAGILVDDESVINIKEGINTIVNDYAIFQRNSYNLYARTDNKATMKKIINKMRGR